MGLDSSRTFRPAQPEQPGNLSKLHRSLDCFKNWSTPPRQAPHIAVPALATSAGRVAACSKDRTFIALCSRELDSPSGDLRV